jgi:citrate lyase subunit beta/citryl-CoA lyase
MSARSLLFAPATRADRVDKALDGAADAVIVDLEDGVPVAEKSLAREALGSWSSSAPYLVRVNAVDSEHFADDVSALRVLDNLDGVVLPMVEHAAQIGELRNALGPNVDVYALIETATGMLNAAEIARAGVVRLLLGSADYCAQLGVPPSAEVLAYPRSTLVVASAAAGLAPPVDGPTLSFVEAQEVETDAQQARALGCGGKLCIHPKQVDTVNGVFSPTAAELAWARRVVEHAETAGDGASALEGTMVDEPVLRRARALLELR